MCWRGRALVAAAAVVSLAVGLDGRNARNVPGTSYVDFKMPEAEEEQSTATPEVTTYGRDKEAATAGPKDDGATGGVTTPAPAVGSAAEEISVDRLGVPTSSFIVDKNKEVANQSDGGGTSPATVAVAATTAPLAVVSQKIPSGPPARATAASPVVTPQKTPEEAPAPVTTTTPAVAPQKPLGGAEIAEEDRVGVPGTSYVDGDTQAKPDAESTADIVFPEMSDHNDRTGANGRESMPATNAPKNSPPNKDKLCGSAELPSEDNHCGLIDLPSKVIHSDLAPKKKPIKKGSVKTKSEERKGEMGDVKTKLKEEKNDIGEYKMKSKGREDDTGDIKTKSKEHIDDIGDYKMKSEENKDDVSVKTMPEGQKDDEHTRTKSKRSVADVKKRKTKKSNTELLNHLGLVKLKSPAVNHHRKRLASQSRKTHLSQVGGDSKVFVIKLPPEPYYFSRHDELEAKSKLGSALPVSFSSNGKPSRVYHWNIPLLKKMVARKAVSPKAAVFASDAFSIDKQATWNEAGDEKPFHRKTAYYAPKKASKEAFRKYFSSNGKPHSFYVMDKGEKPKSTYKLIP